MKKHHVALTAQEQVWLDGIDLRERHASHKEGHEAWKANQENILSLVHSLHERKAIPEERINYCNDPAYNNDRTSASNMEVFERNGTYGADIFIHPHFLPYLRYFLFGADLPDAVVSHFEERVGNPDWVTSSDIVPIGKYARVLAREYGLDRSKAAEEFFKLCLDLGLGLDTARSVRRAVMQLR